MCSSDLGIWDWERQFKQTLVIDLDLGTDISAAAASESITDTIDYKSVSKRVAQVAEEGAFQLVETLAQRIAELLLGEFGYAALKVVVVALQFRCAREAAEFPAFPVTRKRARLRGMTGVGIVLAARGETVFPVNAAVSCAQKN